MAGKIKQQTLPWQYLHFGLSRLDVPALFSYFRFSISYLCSFFLLFINICSSSQCCCQLDKNFDWIPLSPVPGFLLSASLSLWCLSLSVWLSVCYRVFVWLLRLQLHASLTVNSRQAEHTFVLTLFYLWQPLSFPISLSLSFSCSLYIC